METGDCLQVLEGHTDEIFSAAFNYEGDTIITGSKVRRKRNGPRPEQTPARVKATPCAVGQHVPNLEKLRETTDEKTRPASAFGE